MIEHSIKRYAAPVVAPLARHVPALYQPATKVVWYKPQYEAYIVQLKLRGFVEGAKVISKYGIEGVLGPYKECPVGGAEFYNQPWPNCLTIVRAFNNTHMGYNEGELQLISALTA